MGYARGITSSKVKMSQFVCQWTNLFDTITIGQCKIFLHSLNMDAKSPLFLVEKHLIIELVMSPSEIIIYPDFKISQHWHRFLDLFPHRKTAPKTPHPQLIEASGLVVGLWTICFEYKHNFSGHTNNFKMFCYPLQQGIN